MCRTTVESVINSNPYIEVPKIWECGVGVVCGYRCAGVTSRFMLFRSIILCGVPGPKAAQFPEGTLLLHCNTIDSYKEIDENCRRHVTDLPTRAPINIRCAGVGACRHLLRRGWLVVISRVKGNVQDKREIVCMFEFLICIDFDNKLCLVCTCVIQRSDLTRGHTRRRARRANEHGHAWSSKTNADTYIKRPAKTFFCGDNSFSNVAYLVMNVVGNNNNNHYSRRQE